MPTSQTKPYLGQPGITMQTSVIQHAALMIIINLVSRPILAAFIHSLLRSRTKIGPDIA